MASESIAHTAFQLMGYWLRAHSGSKNNCLLVYTHSVILVIQAIWWSAISDYDVIFTALGSDYKAEQNRCRELGVLPKFHSKAFLKIHEYPSADDFEGKKRLHGV